MGQKNPASVGLYFPQWAGVTGSANGKRANSVLSSASIFSGEGSVYEKSRPASRGANMSLVVAAVVRHSTVEDLNHTTPQRPYRSPSSRKEPQRQRGDGVKVGNDPHRSTRLSSRFSAFCFYWCFCLCFCLCFCFYSYIDSAVPQLLPLPPRSTSDFVFQSPFPIPVFLALLR